MNHHQVQVTCNRDHVTLSHKLLAALLHRGIAMHCVLLEKFTTIQLQPFFMLILDFYSLGICSTMSLKARSKCCWILQVDIFLL